MAEPSYYPSLDRGFRVEIDVSFVPDDESNAKGTGMHEAVARLHPLPDNPHASAFEPVELVATGPTNTSDMAFAAAVGAANALIARLTALDIAYGHLDDEETRSDADRADD